MPIRSFAATATRTALVVLTIFACSATAQAATYTTYVASNGSNSRPCNVVTAPCKTLQRAFNVTAANGIVRVLTQVTGGVVINKSITITGDGATVIGQIVVASPSAVVTLHGLALNGIHAISHGVRIDSAAAVHIENCTVERYTGDGISLIATTATKLFVSNTVSRANGSDGLYVEDVNAQAVVENSRFEGNASTGLYLRVDHGNVSDSVMSGNVVDGLILRGGLVQITETAADGNGGHGISLRTGTSFTFLDAAEANGNGAAGLDVESSVQAVIVHCVFIGSPGISNAGAVGSTKTNLIFVHTGNGLDTVGLQ